MASPNVATHLNSESPLLQNFVALLPPAPLPRPETKLANEKAEPSLGPPPLPELSDLLLLDYLGESISLKVLKERAAAFATQYRREAGGCGKEQAERESDYAGEDAEDLFCLEENDLPSYEDADEAQPSHRPSSPTNKHRSDSQDTKDKPVKEKDSTTATATRIHGADGAAVSVDAVRDNARYRETAKAGLKHKLDEGKEYERLPIVNAKEHDLTDLQRAELNDWRAKQRKNGEDGEDGESVAKVGDAKADGRGRTQEGAAGSRALNPPRVAADHDHESLETERETGMVYAQRETVTEPLGSKRRIKGWDEGGVLDEAVAGEPGARKITPSNAKDDASEDGHRQRKGAREEKAPKVEAQARPKPVVENGGTDLEDSHRKDSGGNEAEVGVKKRKQIVEDLAGSNSKSG